MVDERDGARAMLPIAGQATARRDAVRSRHRILTAARRLLAEADPKDLTMNEVAAAAGVGVGTVYRRFGDLAGLLHAVLDDEERDLQARLLDGPLSLGSDTPPTQLVVAFLHEYLDHVERHLALLHQADTAHPGARLAHGSYSVYRTHLARLVARTNPGLDAGYTADLLLAATDAELYAVQRHDRGLSAAAVKEALAGVVEALTRAGPPDAGHRSSRAPVGRR